MVQKFAGGDLGHDRGTKFFTPGSQFGIKKSLREFRQGWDLKILITHTIFFRVSGREKNSVSTYIMTVIMTVILTRASSFTFYASSFTFYGFRKR